MEVVERAAPGESGQRLVLWLVVGLSFAALAAVVAWETVRPMERPEIDPAAWGAATAGAPWLAGLYGTWGQEAEARGDAAGALAAYDQVLAAVPGHPGTCLARARLLVRTGAIADTRARARALADLAAADRGARFQLELLAAPGAPPARATAELLQLIADLRTEIQQRYPGPK